MDVATVVMGAIGTASLAVWLYLALGRGMFWVTYPRISVAHTLSSGDGADWPTVAVIVPARNEAGLLPLTLPTLLKQDYPGPFYVFLVDDRSTDGTAETAQRVARDAGCPERLTIVQGASLPEGWKGKVWAMHQGFQACRSTRPSYLLLTDADTAHAPGMLRALVAKARSEHLQMVSAMNMLRVETFWDRLLITSFVYYFAKLYPFRWIGDPRKRTAGANGGCILLEREAFERAGGFEAMADEMIDDCAVGRLVKRVAGGRVWLGFTRDAHSLRLHGDLSTTWNMVTRYAFAGVGYSWLNLFGVVVGMSLTYMVPPVCAAFGGYVVATAASVSGWWTLLSGSAGWCIMSCTYIPMLRLYRVSPAYAPLLPVSAFLYTLMTIASGVRYARRQGGAWKGRTYDAVEHRF